MKDEKYILMKSTKLKKTTNVDYKNMKGFKVKPHNATKYGCVNVNEMQIIKPDFIDRILKRKVSKKLENYINYLIEVLNDDDADGAKLSQTLNDIERYRTIINNNYKIYLDEKYLKILLRKLKLVEDKLNEKMQIFYQRMQKQIEEKIKNEQLNFDYEEKESKRTR